MILSIVQHAVTITSFVFIMMLLIEYVNVQTHGRWQEALKRGRWRQYLLASLLGAVPGCLGAFTVVSLYTHRILGFGALVAAMIATSGDEAFVMLSMFPVRALALTAVLFAIGVGAAYLTDLAYPRSGRLLRAITAMSGHASRNPASVAALSCPGSSQSINTRSGRWAAASSRARSTSPASPTTVTPGSYRNSSRRAERAWDWSSAIRMRMALSFISPPAPV